MSAYNVPEVLETINGTINGPLSGVLENVIGMIDKQDVDLFENGLFSRRTDKKIDAQKEVYISRYQHNESITLAYIAAQKEIYLENMKYSLEVARMKKDAYLQAMEIVKSTCEDQDDMTEAMESIGNTLLTLFK